MKKILVFTFILIILISSGVTAKNYLNTSYTTCGSGSTLDFSVLSNTSNIAYKGTFTNLSTFIGDYIKFDILAGYFFETENSRFWGSGKNYLMAGIRSSSTSSGTLFIYESISKLGNKGRFYNHSIIEYIIWPDSQNYLTNKFFLAQKLNEKYFIEGGIVWHQGEFKNSGSAGIRFGILNKF